MNSYMYRVFWSAFCCDTGDLNGMHECESLVDALASYAIHIDPDSSDGHASAIIVRADGTRVGPRMLQIPNSIIDRVREEAERVQIAGHPNRLLDAARLLAEVAEIVEETNNDIELSFDRMAARAISYVYR